MHLIRRDPAPSPPDPPRLREVRLVGTPARRYLHLAALGAQPAEPSAPNPRSIRRATVVRQSR